MLKRVPLSVFAAVGVILLIALIGLVTLFAFSVIGRTVLEQFQVQQLQISTSIAQQTEAYFVQFSNEAFRLTQEDTVRAVAESRIQLALDSIADYVESSESSDMILSVTRFNLRGDPRYAWPEQVGQAVGGPDFPYQLPQELIDLTSEGGLVRVDPSFYRVPLTGRAGQFTYLLILPVSAETSNTEFLVIEIDTEIMFNDVLSLAVRDVENSDSGQLWVFDYEGRLVFQARPQPQIDSARGVFTTEVLGALTEADSRNYTADGVERVAALAPSSLLGRQFVILLSRDSSEAQSIVADDLQLIFYIAVVSVILVATLSAFALRRIVTETSHRQSETNMRRTTRSLLEVSRALNSSLQLQTVLERILVELQNLIPYYSASILLLNDQGELDVAAHRGEDPASHAQRVFKAEETRAAREVIARGHPVIIKDTNRDERWTPIPGSDIRSWIGLPLRVFDQSVGVLNINSDKAEGFTLRDLELAEAFADQSSVALQNARLHEREVTRIEQELSVARGIQTSLLPSSSPDIPHLEIAFESTPAQQVSGDYFQFIPLPDDRWGIFVGDVSGKGMPAALIMAVITTALRDEVNRVSNPGELLNTLNIRLLDRLLQNQMNSALIAAVFDPASREIRIANAGMVQPYWRAPDSSWDFVDIGGYPLGASQNTNYSSRLLTLHSGSLMVLFSDGIIEAQNTRGEFFGFERLEILLDSLPLNASAQEVLNRILQAVQQHLGSESAQDDVTVMVIRSLQAESLATPLLPVEALDPSKDNHQASTLLELGDLNQLVTIRPKPVSKHEEYLMPRENVELFLPSVLGFEKVARSAAEAVARKMGFSEDRIDDLKTAVAEACMNAIEHGNLEDKSTSVTVLLSSSEDHLEVRVVDRGRRAIPDPLPPPGDSVNARGWGLFFIHNLMDEVEVLRSPEGNVVRMLLFLGQEDRAGSATTEPSPDASEWIDQNE